MASTYTYTRTDGKAVRVVVPNAAERISGQRGNWSVRCVTKDRSADQHGITSKRVARQLAVKFAEIERNVCRGMGAKRVQPVRHFVADGLKFATCGANTPRLHAADWARVTCTACTSERDKRADAARAARPATVLEMVADAMLPEDIAAAVADDFGATLPPSDNDHRALPRPASSRFIGDDARNGLEASCWECGARIIAGPTTDRTWTHLGEAVDRAHGEALLENLLRMEHLHETALIENATRDATARAYRTAGVVSERWEARTLALDVERAEIDAYAEDRAR